MIVTLSLFWIVSGLIGLARFEAAAEVPIQAGLGAGVSAIVVVGGSILDVTLGFAILFRRWIRPAAVGMIVTTMAYLLSGTILSPALWLDPLGVFVKTIPGIVLALVAAALAEER